MSHVFRLQLNEPGKFPRVLAVEREVELGRDCDGIVVDDPTCSRAHMRLQPTDLGLVVTDLQSSNGTWVNGDEIAEPTIVKPGDTIQIGETSIAVHPGREGDVHAIEVESGESTGGRVSTDKKALSQSANRQARPGQG